MVKWQNPPINKIYEAITAIADGRIEVDGNTAKLYSSSRNKHYDIIYDPVENAITSNDNASFYVGYLGYPCIAFLLKKRLVQYDAVLEQYLKGIPWKDINQKFKNDYDKSDAYVDAQIVDKFGIDLVEFHTKLEAIRDAIISLRLNKLSSDNKPPKGY